LRYHNSLTASTPQGNFCTVERPQEIFYHDLPASRADELAAKLVPQSGSIFVTPLTYAAHKHVPSTYLLCTQDRAIPFPIQQLMVAAAGEGVVSTHVCDASHLPMLSMPETVASVIRKAAGEL
jgi:hypothetical protein